MTTDRAVVWPANGTGCTPDVSRLTPGSSARPSGREDHDSAQQPAISGIWLLADAGIRRVALIVAPDHNALRRCYDGGAPRRVSTWFHRAEALQPNQPVLAAEAWTAGESFLTMNADNLYPVSALLRLAALSEPGLPAFDPADLVRSSNIPVERIRSFAILDVDAQGYLTGIVEKPGDENRNTERFVSMNCWRFDLRIFGMPDRPAFKRGGRGSGAVGLAIKQHVSFKTFPAPGPSLICPRVQMP
jgi:glucose-1-phosphate thymidylyltransferase